MPYTVNNLLWLNTKIPQTLAAGDLVTVPGDWTWTGTSFSFGGNVSVSGDLFVGGSIVSSGTTNALIIDSFIDLNAGYTNSVVTKAGGLTVNQQSVAGTLVLGSTYTFQFVAGVFGVSNARMSIGSAGNPYPTGSATFAVGDVIQFGSLTAPLDDNNGLFVIVAVNDGTDANGVANANKTQIIVVGMATGVLPVNAPFIQTDFASGTTLSGTLNRLDLTVFASSDGAMTTSANPLDVIPEGTFVTAHAASAWVSDPLGSSPPPAGRTELFYVPGTGTSWSLTGNTGLNPAINFVGTTDAVDLVLRSNNVERLRANAAGGVDVLDGPFSLTNTGAAAELRFYEPVASGTNYTAFKAQTQAADVTYTLPAADGAASTVLTTDGSGLLSWSSITGSAWSLTGNAGLSALTNFIGTTDAVDFIVKTNNVTRLSISSAGLATYTGTFDIVGAANITGTTSLLDASALRFYEPAVSGSNYTAFKAQAQTADVTYTLPAADGAADQVLTTDGAGTLSWTTVEAQTVTLVAAENLNAGDVVSIDATGQAQKATTSGATNPPKFYVVGVAKTGATTGNPVSIYSNVLTKVPVRCSAIPIASDNGKPVFLDSAVPGEVVLTLPSAGNAVVRVGILQGADGVTSTPDVLIQLQFVSVIA